MLTFIIGVTATVVATAIGYYQARSFVRTRLRYVDAVQTVKAPIIAGLVAGLVAIPLVALLPIVGIGTAVLFGLGVGSGVAAGARQVRRRVAVVEHQ